MPLKVTRHLAAKIRSHVHIYVNNFAATQTEVECRPPESTLHPNQGSCSAQTAVYFRCCTEYSKQSTFSAALQVP